MLQRIQSIFLFLAAVASVLFLVFPLAGFYGSLETVILYAVGPELQPNTGLTFPSFYAYPMIIGAALSIILSAVAIFLYKKRSVQMRIGTLNIVLNIALLFGIFYTYVSQLEVATGTVVNYKTGVFMPILAILFLVLANRFILKDEKLIRSADRIR